MSQLLPRRLHGMSELRVHNFSVSLDGFGAGPAQTREEPLGAGGEQLHEWIFADDATDVDRRFRAAGEEGIGATIIGRNMFGPGRGPGGGEGTGARISGHNMWGRVRGPGGDEDGRGGGGEAPPFHHDVFVLTHHDRPSVAMSGGTTFHFVSDGIEVALERATTAA